MKTLGYYNGQIGELEEMKVPMLDRACYFGDGVYDACTARNYKIADLDQHIARFYNSARLLEIQPSMQAPELKELLISLCQKVDAKVQFVYWQLSRGAGLRAHVFPEQDNSSRLWIMISPMELPDFSEKIGLITLEDTRFLHCNVKTLNLIPCVIASEKARQADCYEAVFHRDGRVTECAHSNVHILKDGVFRTAPTDNLILPGVTRHNLIDFCRELGVPVDETPFTLSDLMQADEVIVSSCSALCLGVQHIDGQPVGGGAKDLFDRIQSAVLEDFYKQTQE